MEPGDVVGVHGGDVSLTTEDADRAMVISTQPVVLGNDPGPLEDAREGYEKVAFVGQAPTNVRGPVEEGDLVVPSGENDGTAVAVTPGDRSPGTPVVGQAWETDDAEGVTTVTVAVGIDDPGIVEASDTTRERVEDGDREPDRLEAELERRDDRIDEQAARIDALEDENELLRDRVEALERENERLRSRTKGLGDRLAAVEATLDGERTETPPADD